MQQTFSARAGSSRQDRTAVDGERFFCKYTNTFKFVKRKPQKEYIKLLVDGIRVEGHKVYLKRKAGTLTWSAPAFEFWLAEKDDNGQWEEYTFLP